MIKRRFLLEFCRMVYVYVDGYNERSIMVVGSGALQTRQKSVTRGSRVPITSLALTFLHCVFSNAAVSPLMRPNPRFPARHRGSNGPDVGATQVLSSRGGSLSDKSFSRRILETLVKFTPTWHLVRNF